MSDTEVVTHRYLRHRIVGDKRVPYYKRDVPADLRKDLDLTAWWISLRRFKTGSDALAEVERLATAHDALIARYRASTPAQRLAEGVEAIRQRFAEARKGGAPGDHAAVARDAIAAAVQAALHNLPALRTMIQREAAAFRANPPSMRPDGTPNPHQADSLTDAQAALASYHGHLTADRLLAAAADIGAVTNDLDRDERHRAEDLQEDVAAEQREIAAVLARMRPQLSLLGLPTATEPGNSPLRLSAMCELWLRDTELHRDQQRRDGVMEAKHRTRVRLFVEAHGDMLLTDPVLPETLRSYIRVRAKSVAMVTARKDASTLFLIGQWAADREKVTRNPMAGLRLVLPPEKRNKNALRAAFTDEQTARIVTDARRVWASEPDRLGALLTLIATGARASEVLQLRPRDCYPDPANAKRWLISINTEPDADGTPRSIKNAASARVLVLPAAIQAEVLAAKNRNASKSRLFHAITGKTITARVANLSKVFAYLIEVTCEIADPLLSLHSWRHRMVNLMRAAGADQAAIDSQLGHALPDGYGDKIGAAALRPVIDALPVPG